MTARIAAVTFDGDETLWDFRGAMRHALGVAAARFAEAGLRRPDGTVVSAGWLSGLRDEVAARCRGARMEEIRRASLHEAAALTGAPAGFADAVFEAYMRARHERVTLFAGTRPVLETLATSDLRLGLVTNGNSEPARLGIAGLFKAIVVAADCGLRKPDPAIYHHAADRLGVAVNACVHVGDHWEEDVLAAEAAGMTAVWLDHDTPPGHVRSGRPVIGALPDLPPLLARWR